MKKCNIINNRREAIYYEEDDNYNRFNYIIKNIDIIKICIALTTLIIFMWLSIVIVSGSVTTGNNNDIEQNNMYSGRYYMNIQVNKDDTLWSIADRYNNGTENITSYINSLKHLNNIDGDTIYAGDTIIIYYYTDKW